MNHLKTRFPIELNGDVIIHITYIVCESRFSEESVELKIWCRHAQLVDHRARQFRELRCEVSSVLRIADVY